MDGSVSGWRSATYMCGAASGSRGLVETGGRGGTPSSRRRNIAESSMLREQRAVMRRSARPASRSALRPRRWAGKMRAQPTTPRRSDKASISVTVLPLPRCRVQTRSHETELTRDLLGRRLDLFAEFPEPFERRPLARRGDADRADHVAVVVKDRCGGAADPFDSLLVVDRVAEPTHLCQVLVHERRRGDRARRVDRHPRGQDAIDRLGGQRSQDGLAGGRAVDGPARTHTRLERDGMLALDPLDRDDLAVVERGEVDEFLGAVAKGLEGRASDVADVEVVEECP